MSTLTRADRARRWAPALAVLIMAPLTPASAAADLGTVSLTLGGSALRDLRAQGVTVSVAKPARRSGQRIVLPVFGGRVGASARVLLGGGLTFSRRTAKGRRRAPVTLLEVALGARRSTSSARVSGRRRTLLAISHAADKPALDRGSGRATIRGAKVRLTPRGAAAIRRTLGLERLRAAELGRMTVLARLGKGGNPPGQGPGSGPGGPTPAPVPDEPPVLARPAGAVDVTSATITWDLRNSFIRYINAGEGTFASGGAEAGPEEVRDGTSEPLVYTFEYPSAEGWYEPAGGMARITDLGLVRFLYSAHGIDFDAKDPEIEINGESSRAIFRFDGRQDTDYQNKRAVLVDLDLEGTRTTSLDGKTVTYTKMPGTIPQGTANSVFAGMYGAGADFGNVTVSFTTP